MNSLVATDRQLGKKTSFAWRSESGNISGLFSYNGEPGLVWNGLELLDESRLYSSKEEAVKAYLDLYKGEIFCHKKLKSLAEGLNIPY